MTTTASLVTYERADQIAIITLNRPEKLNAFSGTMAADLYASFAEYDKDDDVRVIVVTGAGRAFSAGADLSSGGNTFDADARAEIELIPRNHILAYFAPRDRHASASKESLLPCG